MSGALDDGYSMDFGNADGADSGMCELDEEMAIAGDETGKDTEDVRMPGDGVMRADGSSEAVDRAVFWKFGVDSRVVEFEAFDFGELVCSEVGIDDGDSVVKTADVEDSCGMVSSEKGSDVKDFSVGDFSETNPGSEETTLEGVSEGDRMVKESPEVGIKDGDRNVESFGEGNTATENCEAEFDEERCDFDVGSGQTSVQASKVRVSGR